MAEQEKNYLDIEATAVQIKKGIEEIVGVITENVLENNNKFLTLNVNAEGLGEEPTQEQLLERVHFVLKDAGVQQNPIISNLNEILLGDGNNWAMNSNWYIKETYDNGDGDQYNPTNNLSGKKTKVLGYKNTNLDDITSLILTDGFNKDSLSINFTPGSYENLYNSNSIQIGEKSNLRLRNGAKVDVGRTSTGNTDITKVLIYDGADINIDGGEYRGSNGSPEIFIHGSAAIHIDDGHSSTNQNYYGGPNACLKDISGPRLLMHDRAVASFTQGCYVAASGMSQAYLEGASQIRFSGAPDMRMFGRSSFIMQPNQDNTLSPSVCLNGGSQIIFNSDDQSSLTYDPCLIASPNSFIFMGHGGTGSSTTNSGPELSHWGGQFGGIDLLVPENKNPRFQIADEAMITITGGMQGLGSNWIRIGAGGRLDGVDYKGQNEINLLDNIKFELRQNSIFSLRGAFENPIVDFPITRRKMVDEDGLDCDVSGSILTMYDDAVFIMRGAWPEYTEEDYANYELTDKWSATPSFWKKDGSPLFAMTDNAQCVITGNGQLELNDMKITAENDQFVFSSENETVSFSMEELKKLKLLLENSTIS